MTTITPQPKWTVPGLRPLPILGRPAMVLRFAGKCTRDGAFASMKQPGHSAMDYTLKQDQNFSRSIVVQ